MGRKKKIRKKAVLLDLPPDLVSFREDLMRLSVAPKRPRSRYQNLRTAVRLEIPSGPQPTGAVGTSVLEGSQGPPGGGLADAENTQVEASVPLITGDSQYPPEALDDSDFSVVLSSDTDMFAIDDFGFL